MEIEDYKLLIRSYQSQERSSHFLIIILFILLVIFCYGWNGEQQKRMTCQDDLQQAQNTLESNGIF